MAVPDTSANFCHPDRNPASPEPSPQHGAGRWISRDRRSAGGRTLAARGEVDVDTGYLFGTEYRSS